MSGSVVPFKRYEIEQPPQPDVKRTTITVDDKGRTTIEIGADTAPKQRARKKPSADRFDHNLAEDMDDSALAALAAHLIEGIEDDDSNRSEWVDTVNRTADYLGIKLKDPVNDVAADGTVCQAIATCMQEVALKLWGTAYGELLPVGGPVKVQREEVRPAQPAAVSQPGGTAGIAAGQAASGGAGGIAPPLAANDAGSAGTPPTMGILPPSGGLGAADDQDPSQEPENASEQAGDDLADALEQDMNWYLTNGDKGYYPDFSAMLFNRPLVGPAFREQFHCPVQRKPISRWVMAQDVIVSGNPAHVQTASRYTLRKKVSQGNMKRMMARGHFRKIGLTAPTGRTSTTEITIGQSIGISPNPTLPRDFEHEVLQCHCELGSGTTADLFGDLEMLDEDENGHVPGFPLPYRVTMDYDSRTVLEIRRDWKRGDDNYMRRRRLVKYGFIPAFGGKFYDYGLIHLVGNPTQAATMLMRSSVDAGVFANFPAWAVKQGAATKFEKTTMRPGPGELVKVPISGSDKLSDNFMPWPYKEPSPQTMALMEKLESDVKSIGGVIDIPVGEGRIGNTPVGTIMSYIESVSMVPGAVHKADHIAQSEEFENLRELLAEHPECLTRGNKSPARQWQLAEELLRPDIMPKADPNTPSQYHRLFKVQAAIQMGGEMQFNMPEQIANQRALYRKGMEVLWGTDAREFENPPQPTPPTPPDPKLAAAMLKAQTEDKALQGKQQEIQLTHAAKMQELQQTSQDKAADRASDERREQMKLAGQHVKTGADMVEAGVSHAADAHQQAAEHQHELGSQQLDHAHDAALGAQQQQHEAAQQGAQQQHELLSQPPPDEGGGNG